MSSSIESLDIAYGLKECLVDNGFTTIDRVMSIPSTDLAVILGIDSDVAKLIKSIASCSFHYSPTTSSTKLRKGNDCDSSQPIGVSRFCDKPIGRGEPS